jgi:PAS domain S-box-containing protein
VRQLQYYSIGEVAALLGVSPHAIRAWERRYGILRPERGVNRHRRYSAEDIEFLRDVKRTADINGTSLRLALEIVNGSLDLSAATSSPARPKLVVPEYGDNPTPSDVWRTLGDTVPFLLMLLDAEGVVVEANVAVARLLGIVRQRVAGRKFIGLVDPFDRMKASMLYRPQLRAVSSWELNLTMKDGAKLFSFDSWPVLIGDETYLAVMGTEMFTHGETAAPALGVRGAAGAGGVHALHGLFDSLPVGVAVATVGREPRIVYSNLSLNLQLRLPARHLLGLRVSDVLGPELVRDVLRTSTRARVTATTLVVKGSLRTVITRPMWSANGTVTSCLIVVMTETSTTDAAAAETSSHAIGR